MADMHRTLSVGTLGGPGTFAHQASVEMQRHYPALGDLTYFPSMDDVYGALETGIVDAVILTEQTTLLGWDEADERVAGPDKSIYVYGATVVPYGCKLLGRDGTELASIDGIYGHGSIRQCRKWLAEHLPGVPAVVHEKNSVEAAREVAAGDGSKVVVGTGITAELTGLATLADGIDEGATGNWWALTAEPYYFEEPEHIIISVRLPGDGALAEIGDLMATQGFRLATAYTRPTTREIFEYDYLLTGIGTGRTASVLSALERFEGARLVGAYRLHG